MQESTALSKSHGREFERRASAGSFRVKEWLTEFWYYRELFFFLVWRDVKIRYKQTALGALWAIIQPFFTMVIFTVFFGRMAGIQEQTGGIPYPVFTFSALIPWTYFSNALSTSGNSLVRNANLLRKVYFPRVAIPASSCLGALVDFSIAFLVLVGMMIYYKIPFTLGLLLWPVLLVPMVMVTLGFGLIFSSLNVKYRDIKYAIPFFIQSMLFVTPIIYPVTMVPERFRFLLALNPLTGIIEAFRAAVLPSRVVDWQLVGTSFAVIIVVFLFGVFYFHRTEREFADIV